MNLPFHIFVFTLIAVAVADAMYRTPEKSQKFETQYDIFMNNKNKKMRPCIRFLITATPVPALLALGVEVETDDIKFERTEPSDDYVGVDEMVSLCQPKKSLRFRFRLTFITFVCD